MTESDITGLVDDLAAKVSGAGNLTTAGAIPKVSSAGELTASRMIETGEVILVNGDVDINCHSFITNRANASPWNSNGVHFEIDGTVYAVMGLDNSSRLRINAGLLADGDITSSGNISAHGQLWVQAHVGAIPSSNPDAAIIASFGNADKSGDTRILDVVASPSNNAILRPVGNALGIIGGQVGINTSTPHNQFDVAYDSDATGGDTAQIAACAATNPDKRTYLGFDPVRNIGFVQAGERFVSWRDLSLCPNGGKVGIGYHNFTPAEMLDVAGNVRSHGQVIIEQKEFGGYAGLLIKGLSAVSNWPNIGFSTQNSSSVDVIGAGVQTQIIANTAGAEAMDLLFATMNSGSLTEKMRISHDGTVSVAGTLTAKAAKFHYDDSGNPTIFLEGQKNTDSDKQWGSYSITANSSGIDFKNAQTGTVMAHFGAGPAASGVNGSDGSDGDLAVPFDVNCGGILQMSGGSPVTGKLLRCVNSVGGSEWHFLDATDIPLLDCSKITSGRFDAQRLGADAGGLGYDNPATFLRGDMTWAKPPQGTVNAFTVLSGPLTVSITNGTATVDSAVQAPNTVYAGPASSTSGNQKPTFRSIVPADFDVAALATSLETYFYTRTMVDGNDPGVCYTREESDSNFYSKSDMDSILGGYQAAGSAVDFGTMESYVSSALGSYTDSSTLSSTLSNYIPWSGIDSYLQSNYGLTKL